MGVDLVGVDFVGVDLVAPNHFRKCSRKDYVTNPHRYVCVCFFVLFGVGFQ